MAEATVPNSIGATTHDNSSENVSTDTYSEFMKERFEVELEFVQCLANPWYINIIAQQGYFDKPEFINYLKYLKYWKRPEYARFIVYPHALAFLDLLQSKEFREDMKKIDEATRVHELQYHHWRWPNHEVDGADEAESSDAAKPPSTASTSG